MSVVSQTNPMPKRYFLGRHILLLPFTRQSQLHLRPQRKVTEPFLEPWRDKQGVWEAALSPPTQALSTAYAFSTATMMGRARRELLLQESKQEMGYQSVLSCRTPNLRGCTAGLLL